MTDNRDRSEAQFADGRALQPFPDDLPTLAEGLERLLSRVAERMKKRSRPVERVPLEAAHGRVLAQEVAADAAMPPFDRATMDGYAVRSEDIRGAGPGNGVSLLLAGNVAVGETAKATVGPSQAVAVATGSMLPPGADAVVPGEWCRIVSKGDADGHSVIVVTRPVAAGGNTLARGSDLRGAEVAVSSGTVLGPTQIGVLAALGVDVPVVFPRPKVHIVATGAELVPPSREPGPGQIRDSNSYALVAAAAKDGAEAEGGDIVSDDFQSLLERLDEATKRSDVVLVSGGSSVGKTDYTRDVLKRLGADVVLHGLKVKPGKPTLAALLGNTVVIGLPGNPVSALTIYAAVVRPVLRRLAGWSDPFRIRTVTARLSKSIRRDPEREEFVRVRLHGTGEDVRATPVLGSSGMLHSMARADGHTFIPLHREGFDEGERIQVEVYD